MKAELNWSEIAILVGVHQSTISRERRRNCGLQSYWPKQAYQRALHYATQRPSCVFVKRIGVASIARRLVAGIPNKSSATNGSTSMCERTSAVAVIYTVTCAARSLVRSATELMTAVASFATALQCV